MRMPRLKAPPSVGSAFYHCISRVVERRFHFGPVEKEMFVQLMREYEQFCGVYIITYCVMSNHFHVLLEVPPRPEQLPSDEELVKRIEGLSGLAGSAAGATRRVLEDFRKNGHDDAAEALREKFFARMWDLSAFMKLLKQRFTQWFNHQHDRRGTLWEERFKSVLVEGEGQALLTMAAYIDLNPVRAGLVKDPAEYRWSGYGEAASGRRGAREALRKLVTKSHRHVLEATSMEAALREYRTFLFGTGEENDGVDAQGRPLRRGLSPEKVAEVIEGKGRLPAQDYVWLRVRYFVDGAVIGSRGFVDDVFRRYRKRFGEKRKDGARRIRGVESDELFAMRDLQVDPLK
jgi:putative transposase